MNAQRMRGGALRRLVLAACASLALVAAPATALAAQTYQVYPTPHAIEYGEGEVTLPETVNVVLDPGVDAETEKRLNDILALKQIKANKVDAPGKDANAVEVLVGINGSKGPVDQLVQSGAVTPQVDLFKKTDANFVTVLPKGKDAPARIVVVGRDTDAAFYGLSTLYQVFQQIEGRTLAAFTVNDWADVETRGFIEGYYGNPWSTEGRVELMRWGGLFKQNAYIYAPKDDPKHNAQWRDLYSTEEIAKLSQLAQAGNESKCCFVYALHPFMNSPISFGSSYESDLATLKAKYLQVIDAGCRQIMLSADDADSPGADNYKRLLTDLTNWLHDLQQMKNEDGSFKYPGLKDTIPFVENKYYDAGASGSWYNTLPENVRVITTGKQVWGKADKSTIDTFKSRTGVAPFMWINWPCTDNTRDHLSMGGYENALGADVTPGSLVGCVINPMQQSEPSKVGIFLNADFSWNNWTSYDHADKVWSDAFSFVDHDSPADTDASNALRTLSEHMKWYQGGGVTFESRESEAVKPMLDAFKAKIEDGSVKVSDIDQVEALFKELLAAAGTYAQNAGNASLRTQIDPWLGFWSDGMNAGLRYLGALRGHLNGDKNALVSEYTQGKELFDNALLHSYPYVNDTQYARAGTRAVWPVVEALGEYLRPVVGDATGTVDVVAEVTLKGLGTSGNPANIIDGDTSTYAHFSGSNATTNVNVGDSFTITYEPYQRADAVTFVQSVPSNRPQDVLKDALVEYTTDGTTWVELGHVNGDSEQTLKLPKTTDLKGLRFTNKQYYSGYWQVNEVATSVATESPAGAILTDIEGAALAGTADSTSAAISAGKVAIPAGSYVAIDLASVQANIAIDEASAAAVAKAGLTVVSSVNALSWDAVENNAVASARYVGVRNLSDHEITFDFSADPFRVTYPGVPGDFTCDSDPVDEAHGTSAMLDGRVTTYWRPANASGTLTYHVSEPLSGDLPRNGVHIVSWGDPSGAKVTATVYDKPDYSSTTEVELGTLDASVNDFSFAEAANGRFWGVKEVKVGWSDGVVPSIAEVSMLDTTFEPQPLPETHTVTFMVDDTVFSKVEVEDGSAVAAPENAPAKDGFTFDGWYLDDAAYDFAAPVTGDLTLVAHFTPKGDQGGDQGGDQSPDPDDKPGTNPGNKPSGKPGAGLPSTGDSAMLAVVGVAGVAVAAFAAGAVMKKRRA